MRILFVCSRNRLRSPTAARVFETEPGLEVDSAGLNRDAENPLTREQVEWADIIFVMETAHRNRLRRRFGKYIRSQRIICLDIPDRYTYMEDELVKRLRLAVGPHL